MPRERLPSVPEIDERLRKVEERISEHELPQTRTSTPPAVRPVLDYFQKKGARFLLKLLLAALLGAATWYGGWVAKDCANGRAPTTYPAPGTLK